jgi:hypothetical protein
MISRLQPKLAWIACALLSAASLTAASSATSASPATAAQSPPGSPNKAAEQSDRISQQIDALLKRRLNPEGLPQLLPNPFAVASANVATLRAGGSDSETPSDGSVDASAAAPLVQPAAAPATSSAAEILARCAAELKIGGVIEQRGELQIVINGVPRKEGDFVVVGLDKSTVRLEILHILPRGIVVRLGDAELTVRF